MSGSPFSPKLLKVYMDTYLAYLDGRQKSSKNAPKGKERSITVFADSVKLHAKDIDTLQKRLNVFREWADTFCLTWSTCECKVLVKKTGAEGMDFDLDGEKLEQSTEAHYLAIKTCRHTTRSTMNIRQVKYTGYPRSAEK